MEKSTWSADRTALNHLLEGIAAHRAVHSIESSELQTILDVMARREYQPSTLFTYRKSWQTFFRWCGPHDPTKGALLRELDRQDVRTFEADELVRLRTAADRVAAQRSEPNARLAIEIALCMGLRQGEVFALRWESIDPATRSVRVRWQIPKDSTVPKGLKGKRARTALVLPEWWTWMQPDATGYICGKAGRPIGTRSQRELITRVLDTAGLNETGLGWHVLRHTYARHFVERGGRFEELQKSLGHRSITTTEGRYGHFHEDVAVHLAGKRIYGS
jgi:site-specific recombinase XerD